jgi:hypothetical protein
MPIVGRSEVDAVTGDGVFLTETVSSGYRRFGQALNPFEIQVLFRHQPDGIDGGGGPAVFGRRYQAHVALGKTLFPQLRHRPQYRYTGVRFDAARQNTFVPLAGHPIQDHAADVYIGVERGDPGHHGSHGTGGLGGIDAQDHRQAKQLGQFGGAGFPFGVDTVVEAAVALDNGKIGILGMGAIGSENGVPVNEKGVQIVAGPAGRKASQPASI